MRLPVALAFALFACSTGPSLGSPDGSTANTPPIWIGLAGDRMPPLPAWGPGRSDRFVTSEACAQCHSSGDPDVLRDSSGHDVSPPTLWRASMMANAARDPFYLAQTSYELSLRPSAKDAIESACISCHTPAATTDLQMNGMHLGWSDLTTSTAPIAHLGREGVTCSLCHQIAAKGLGTQATFDGHFEVGEMRLIYGPHANPLTMPMQMFVNYTPVQATHISDSGLCGSCHTVITPALDAQGKPTGAQFVEQGAYLEWANSDFLVGPRAASCQSCHMPAKDDGGNPIMAVLSLKPSGLMPRSPIGRHLLIGGNAQMLSVMADNTAWTGAQASPTDLLGAAARAQDSLRRAVKLSLDRAARTNGTLVLDVTVENQCGHKFPTGYPSRRAWLHVRVSDGDRVVFESGGWDAYGRVVARSGAVIDARDTVRPHLDVIDSDATAQIWELVPGSSDGVARSLLSATRALKDDRLLPSGWSKTGLWSNLTAPVGVDGDDDFGARDTVTYRVANAPARAHVVIELLFQSVRPSELQTLAEQPTPASRSFLDMIAKRSAPFAIATITQDL
jgi:hypothetical protein